jgi:hypothetical protein
VLCKSMCQATLDWLEANGFPTEPGDMLLLLRDGSRNVVDAKDRGTAMAEWIGDHGTELFRSMVEGAKEQYAIVPSYGYVDSDVVADAYLASGVPAEHIFTIGNKGVSRLEYKGTHAIVRSQPRLWAARPRIRPARRSECEIAARWGQEPGNADGAMIAGGGPAFALSAR